MATRSFRTVAGAFALAAPLLLAQTPAHAAEAAVVVGAGSISPGVPLTGCVENANISFAGIGLLAGTSGMPAGPYDVAFLGNSTTCESVASGAGFGQLSGDVAGTVQYTRATGVITLAGTVTINGQTKSLLAECNVVIGTNVNPITDFTLECNVALTP